MDKNKQFEQAMRLLPVAIEQAEAEVGALNDDELSLVIQCLSRVIATASKGAQREA